MAWETRKRGGTYYTRSRRIGGRVVREYVGRGLVGALAFIADKEARLQREANAYEWQSYQAQMDDLDRPLDELGHRLALIIHGAFVLAGYRQHHRGEWRRKRV